ncbi:hypothetical protein U9M48_001372 [Paspalum notatum var. saurae]|uniref:Uncharacterized protein n=1 Tax=Paspalum notatum var. saurae TaxID=547442 RepID=A0AAQ3PGA4_PASNO
MPPPPSVPPPPARASPHRSRLTSRPQPLERPTPLNPAFSATPPRRKRRHAQRLRAADAVLRGRPPRAPEPRGADTVLRAADAILRAADTVLRGRPPEPSAGHKPTADVAAAARHTRAASAPDASGRHARRSRPFADSAAAAADVLRARRGRPPEPSAAHKPTLPGHCTLPSRKQDPNPVLSMGQRKTNIGRTPLADIANNIGGHQDEPNVLTPIIDAKERKRQRDRERYAAMSEKKRDEKNKKRREARQRNKGRPMMPGSSTEDMGADTQQLHMNQTSKAVNIEESVDMATGSGTTFQESCEINKKRHEPSTGNVQEDMDPDDNSDWLHQNETYPTKHMKTSEDLLTPDLARLWLWGEE